MGSLKSIPHIPNININRKDEQGQTLLIRSLREKRSKSFTMQLIQNCCNVNISDKMKITPSHLAISLSLNDVACELIKKGAKLNVQGEERIQYESGDERSSIKTPLHTAVMYDNVEGACMLLYYGANVYITNGNKRTPLKAAICEDSANIAKILINFYDDSYYACESLPSPDYMSVYWCFFQHLGSEGTLLLGHCFHSPDAELFKLLWNKISLESFITDCELFLLLHLYVQHSPLTAPDWLECLYLILNMFVIRQFTISYINIVPWKTTNRFFHNLLKAFRKKNIESADRLAIITIYVSLDAPVWIEHLEEVHQLYGFDEELEVLIYGYTVYDDRLCNIFSFILAVEKNVDNTLICELFKSYFLEFDTISNNDGKLRFSSDYFNHLLRFFSLAAEVKEEIIYLCHDLEHVQNDLQKICEKLEQILELPSLGELCRNKVRKYIKKSNSIRYPYQFHDAVKKLNCPKVIQDIIRFKTPLY